MTQEERRRRKHPDTDTFHYHNANPKNKLTTDCVVRALCTGLQLDYTTVVMELAQMQCSTGYDDGDSVLIDKYLKSKGWVKCKQPRKEDNTKYTGKEFCRKLSHPIYSEELNLYSMPFNWHRVICNIGGHHIVAVVEGQVWDIWNSTGGCVGNVWVQPA